VTRRATLGDRAFPVVAARAWNALPDYVTSAPTYILIITSPARDSGGARYCNQFVLATKRTMYLPTLIGAYNIRQFGLTSHAQVFGVVT